MSEPGTPEGCERLAYAVGFLENATYSDVYGGGGAVVGLDCHLVRPRDKPSETLIVFMHPTGGGMYLPMSGSWLGRATTCSGPTRATAVQTTR